MRRSSSFHQVERAFTYSKPLPVLENVAYLHNIYFWFFSGTAKYACGCGQSAAGRHTFDAAPKSKRAQGRKYRSKCMYVAGD